MENKIKLKNALVVNKSEITRLQESQMSKIKGGFSGSGSIASCVAASCISSCQSNSCNGSGAAGGYGG
jgi:hypothetical protein